MHDRRLTAVAAYEAVPAAGTYYQHSLTIHSLGYYSSRDTLM